MNARDTENWIWQTGRGRWVAGAVLCCLAAAAIVWFSLPEPGQSTSPLPSEEEVGIEPNFGASVPDDLQFVDESGQPVRLARYFGDRPVILAPVYFECPMLCNLTMDGLVRGLRGLSLDVGRDFEVLTVSFDPREEPPLAAAAKRTAMDRYARQGAQDGWHFLTGQEQPIKALTDTIGFRYSYDVESAQYVHAAGLFVLSPEGKVSRFLGGVDFSPRDLKLALSEATDGGQQDFTDQVLLLCFHYDPTTGKYGLAILRLIRFAGILTVGMLVTGIAVMVRKEAQGRGPASNQDHSSEAYGG